MVTASVVSDTYVCRQRIYLAKTRDQYRALKTLRQRQIERVKISTCNTTVPEENRQQKTKDRNY